MQRVVYYSHGGYNNGNSQWVSEWLIRNRSFNRNLGLGLAFAVAVYVFGPTVSGWLFGQHGMFGSTTRRSDKYTTGLINNRNDCFANSSVQALSSLVYLTKYLNDILKQTQLLTALIDVNSGQKDNSNDLSTDPVPVHTGNVDVAPRPARPELWKAHASTATIRTLQFHDAETPKSGLSEESSLNGDNSSLSDQSSGGIEHNGSDTTENTDGTDFSAKDIPKIPMHESLAQVLYQLQQTVNAEHHISIWPFLRVIERIFKAKISTGQNDAHELTQVVLQTLENENLALRKFVKSHSVNVTIPRFPVHGSLADSLFCLSCGESSRVNVHDFTMFPLPVPQTMDANLAQMISDNQTDQISGYSCVCCKLRAIIANEKNRKRRNNTEQENKIVDELEETLPNAFINEDLSNHLAAYVNSYDKDGIKAADIKSTIVKKTVVVKSPDLLILHLSRSVFNGVGYQKNTCNVTFDEELVVNRQIIDKNKCVGIEHDKYKLKALLRHQGSHSAGHYECYKRKPEFMKDVDTHQVINKTPMIDFGADSNKLAAEAWNEAITNYNKGSTSSSSSINSNESLSSNVPFRSVFLDSPNLAIVADDDYVIGSSECLNTDKNDKKKVSRTSSTLKKVTGFLSRKGSVSVVENNTVVNPTSNNESTSITGSSPQETISRSRFNSISSSVQRGRSDSMASSATDVSADSYSTDQVTNTSVTELETDTDLDASSSGVEKKTRKRRLKKLVSVTKYPWWRISDTRVKECKTMDVLSETKFVYMLYYEKVPAVVT